MDNYDIVADKVRSFWKETYPQVVIAFFFQKYNFESEWEYCTELIYPHGSDDYDTVIFHTDFWEGQTEIKDIKILPLDEIIEFYEQNCGQTR